MTEDSAWARRRQVGEEWKRPPASRRWSWWIGWAVLGVVVVALAAAGNEWRIRRDAARLESQASAAIDVLELPPWLIELERDAVGFHCHFWSGCQERFVSVTYGIDVSQASPEDRVRPCLALIAALRDWDIEHAPPERCGLFATRDGLSLQGGIQEESFALLRTGAGLDRAQRAELSVYL